MKSRGTDCNLSGLRRAATQSAGAEKRNYSHSTHRAAQSLRIEFVALAESPQDEVFGSEFARPVEEEKKFFGVAIELVLADAAKAAGESTKDSWVVHF